MSIAVSDNPDPAAAALAMARANGCDCDPDVSLRPDADGVTHARVAHDDWCRLLAVVERRN